MSGSLPLLGKGEGGCLGWTILFFGGFWCKSHGEDEDRNIHYSHLSRASSPSPCLGLSKPYVPVPQGKNAAQGEARPRLTQERGNHLLVLANISLSLYPVMICGHQRRRKGQPASRRTGRSETTYPRPGGAKTNARPYRARHRGPAVARRIHNRHSCYLTPPPTARSAPHICSLISRFPRPSITLSHFRHPRSSTSTASPLLPHSNLPVRQVKSIARDKALSKAPCRAGLPSTQGTRFRDALRLGWGRDSADWPVRRRRSAGCGIGTCGGRRRSSSGFSYTWWWFGLTGFEKCWLGWIEFRCWVTQMLDDELVCWALNQLATDLGLGVDTRVLLMVVVRREAGAWNVEVWISRLSWRLDFGSCGPIGPLCGVSCRGLMEGLLVQRKKWSPWSFVVGNN